MSVHAVVMMTVERKHYLLCEIVAVFVVSAYVHNVVAAAAAAVEVDDVVGLTDDQFVDLALAIGLKTMTMMTTIAVTVSYRHEQWMVLMVLIAWIPTR